MNKVSFKKKKKYFPTNSNNFINIYKKKNQDIILSSCAIKLTVFLEGLPKIPMIHITDFVFK